MILEPSGSAIDGSGAGSARVQVASLAHDGISSVHLGCMTADEMDVKVVLGREGLGISVGVMMATIGDGAIEAVGVDDVMMQVMGRLCWDAGWIMRSMSICTALDRAWDAGAGPNHGGV